MVMCITLDDVSMKHPLEVKPIELPSLDPRVYRCDYLQKLIPLVANPSGKYVELNIYSDH